MVSARDILSGEWHGGQRDGGGGEMRTVVGGPTASGLGREPQDLSGQTGCSGGRRNDDGASLLVAVKRPCTVVLVSGVSQWTSRYRPGRLMHRRDGSTARGQTRQSSPWELLRPGHSTTAIPGTTLSQLLHTQLAEEAWGWSESSRHPGKSQAAHNPKVGVPSEAGRIWPGGEGGRLRVAQSGMGTTPQRLGGIDRITDGSGRRNPVGHQIGSQAGAHRAHSRWPATGGLEAALAEAMRGKAVS